MSAHRQCPILNDAGLRGLVWVFIGLVYAFIFVSVAESTRELLGSPFNFMFATVAAAALTALFYGSMRLAVIIANAVLVTTLLFLMFGKDSGLFTLPMLILIPAALGMLIGAGYGWRDRGSRVCCADAKIIAGLFAGAVTLLPALLVLAVFGGSDQVVYPWLVMLLAPMAGSLYVTTACWFVRRLHHLLPPLGDGALVGLGIGAITGLLFVVIAGTFEPDVTGHGRPLHFIENVYRVIDSTLVGAAVSCFALGVGRAFLRVDWYKL